MLPVPVWFERRFDFDFPAQLYPNLLMRLRVTPAGLEEALRGAASHVLTAQREGKWSAQEHAGHLLDMEPLWMARINDFLGDGETMTVADLSNRKTHEANHNAGDLNETLTRFREERSRLLSRLTELEPALFSRTRLHPRLQEPMRLVDHLYFVAEHDGHHLAMIWQVLQSAK